MRRSVTPEPLAFLQQFSEAARLDVANADQDLGDVMTHDDGLQAVAAAEHRNPFETHSVLLRVVVDEPDGLKAGGRVLQDFAHQERPAAAGAVDEHTAPADADLAEVAVDAARHRARAHQEEPRHERVDHEHASGEPLEAEHEQDEQDRSREPEGETLDQRAELGGRHASPDLAILPGRSTGRPPAGRSRSGSDRTNGGKKTSKSAPWKRRRNAA